MLDPDHRSNPPEKTVEQIDSAGNIKGQAAVIPENRSKEEFCDMVANTWGGKGELAIFGDLGPAGITKKTAIEKLLAYIGADREDTISFGDAKIDLSMFEQCAYNVAMGNGGKEIKEAADYITSDVNDDGIYNAFRHLGLTDLSIII